MDSHIFKWGRRGIAGLCVVSNYSLSTRGAFLKKRGPRTAGEAGFNSTNCLGQRGGGRLAGGKYLQMSKHSDPTIKNMPFGKAPVFQAETEHFHRLKAALLFFFFTWKWPRGKTGEVEGRTEPEGDIRCQRSLPGLTRSSVWDWFFFPFS